MEKEITLITLIKKFNKGDVRYLIIGRRAVILYGAPVLTADYDLWIDSKKKLHVLTLLKNMDVELTHTPDTKRPIVTAFSGMKKFDLFFHKGITTFKGVRLDFDKCYCNSELIDDPSQKISFRVPSIDDLIKMKQIREKNVKDEQDIEYLLKAKKIKQ